MTDPSRYTLAQALWLAREFPNTNIDPAKTVRITFTYSAGREWSSVTFEDPEFYITVHHEDGSTQSMWLSNGTVDVTRMVVEGLEILAELEPRDSGKRTT